MKTRFSSYKLRSLPKGCKLCVKGKKTVLFITGVCPRRCTYCPLSEQKKNKDVIFANEVKISEFEELIKEAKSHKSKGAGITGGDPLARLNRTCEYIKKLKDYFGKNYHIHLYTSLDLVNEKTLTRLYDAGLDEIRFHPEITKSTLWERIKSAKKFDWDVGIEIPVIPDEFKKTIKLIDFISDKVDFINLNEFEYSDNFTDFSKYKTRNPETYAIEGSLEAGLKILKYIKKKYKLNAHLCTAKLKDSVQLKNRLKLKAKSSKLPFDKIKEGLLIRNCIYHKSNSPRNKSLAEVRKNAKKYLPILKKETKIINKFFLDEKNCRIIISKSTLKRIPKKSNLDYGKIEEYPTEDQFLTSAEFR